MTVWVLYLHLIGWGWIEFETYTTSTRCDSIKTHLEEQNAPRLEGLCLEVVNHE